MSATLPSQLQVEVMIVGSGFAGIGMAIQLRLAGRNSFVICEQASQIGGTWRANTYPGCACDVPGYLYSFSFAPKFDWQRVYASQREILEYLQHCVNRYDLHSALRLNCQINQASFDESSNYWQVKTNQGEIITARVLVLGIGPLSQPAYPEIKGAAQFQGKVFHSANWDHSYDLRGRRVALIGSGASAIQIVPRLAPLVQQLSIFQRTPAWILPKKNPLVSPAQRWINQSIPGALRLKRWFLYWQHERMGLGFIGYSWLMKRAQRFACQYLERKITDPYLRKKLQPTDLIGCKRVLLSSDYLPSLQAPQVELVTERIREIDAHSITTQDGQQRTIDTLIYCTGFRARDYLTPLKILGRNRIALQDVWRDEPSAYYGMTINGYPNFFTLIGPNTGLAHHSMISVIEAQARYIVQCLKLLDQKNAAALEVRPSAQKKFHSRLMQRMQHTSWLSGCTSWYLNHAGNNTVLWPGLASEYILRTRRVIERDYFFI